MAKLIALVANYFLYILSLGVTSHMKSFGIYKFSYCKSEQFCFINFNFKMSTVLKLNFLLVVCIKDHFNDLLLFSLSLP